MRIITQKLIRFQLICEINLYWNVPLFVLWIKQVSKWLFTGGNTNFVISVLYIAIEVLSLLCVSDGKDQSDLTWEGTNPALQTIQVRNTVLKNTLADVALPRTTGATPGHLSNP